MAPVIGEDIAAALRQNRATVEDFRAWCASRGLSRFETYAAENQWGFVRDFLAQRGTTARPSMLAPSRPSLASSSPGRPAGAGPRVITRADGLTEDVSLDAMARRRRDHREAKRAELDAAAASGRCGCEPYRLCPAHTAIRNREL